MEQRRFLRDGVTAQVLRNHIAGQPLLTDKQKKYVAIVALASTLSSGIMYGGRKRLARKLTEQQEIFLVPAVNSAVGNVVSTLLLTKLLL